MRSNKIKDPILEGKFTSSDAFWWDCIKSDSVDYIKAMEYAFKYPDKISLLDTLNMISKMYIPKIVYKFVSLTEDNDLNDKKLKTLENKQIFLSKSDDFNDPFDNKAYYYSKEKLKNKIEYIDFIRDDMLISSLTSNDYSCMPMWAHYANDEKGFCISYRTDGNIELYRALFPVQYVKKRVDLTDNINKCFKKQTANLSYDFIDTVNLSSFLPVFLCNLKNESWKAENEIRVVTLSGIRKEPYINALPYKIYIGRKCNDKYIRALLDIGEKINADVYKIKIDKESENFNLIIDN